jgi:hypothetical protein
LCFEIKEGSDNTASLIEFLTELHDHLEAQPVTLIWDGLSAHRSKDMKAWLATQRHWLLVEQLPGYAHDLNSTTPASLYDKTSLKYRKIFYGNTATALTVCEWVAAPAVVAESGLALPSVSPVWPGPDVVEGG